MPTPFVSLPEPFDVAAWGSLWIGPYPAPDDVICLDDPGLLGLCVEPGLGAVVAAVGTAMCVHTSDPYRLCLSCGMALRELAELIRDSAGWSLHGGSFVDAVGWALHAYARAGLIDGARAHALCLSYDAEQRPIDYLKPIAVALPFTWGIARSIIAAAHDGAGRRETHFVTDGICPRDEVHRPPRTGYQRFELEIARRKGWPKPQRHMLEERVRGYATASHNEAQFVRLCTDAGVQLIPKTGTPHLGIVGYSAQLVDLPAEDRIVFSGKTLARDLTLPMLREIQWEQPSTVHTNAWATWMALCSDPASLNSQPAPRSDRRWRWILPEVAEAATESVPELSEHPTQSEVRAYLRARQGNACAMCQIRRRDWTATTGTSVPLGLLGQARNLDHDHATGLVRGLLCNRCNSIAEPAGIVTREDVWRTYTDEPPIGHHKIVHHIHRG